MAWLCTQLTSLQHLPPAGGRRGCWGYRLLPPGAEPRGGCGGNVSSGDGHGGTDVCVTSDLMKV